MSHMEVSLKSDSMKEDVGLRVPDGVRKSFKDSSLDMVTMLLEVLYLQQ